MRGVVLCNSRSRIDDETPRGSCNEHHEARFGVDNGVSQQIAEHRLKVECGVSRFGIRIFFRVVSVEPHFDKRQTLRLGARLPVPAKRLGHVPERRTAVVGSRFDSGRDSVFRSRFFRPVLVSGELQKEREQTAHRFRGLENARDELTLFVRLNGEFQKFRRGADDREGRAQFVAHVARKGLFTLQRFVQVPYGPITEPREFSHFVVGNRDGKRYVPIILRLHADGGREFFNGPQHRSRHRASDRSGHEHDADHAQDDEEFDPPLFVFKSLLIEFERIYVPAAGFLHEKNDGRLFEFREAFGGVLLDKLNSEKDAVLSSEKFEELKTKIQDLIDKYSARIDAIEQAEKEAKDKLEQEAQTIIDEGKEKIEEVIEPENNSYTEESNTAAESTDTDSNYDSSDDDSDTPNDLVPITPFEIPDDYIYTY